MKENIIVQCVQYLNKYVYRNIGHIKAVFHHITKNV